MKDIPDEIAQRFTDASFSFAADLSKPIQTSEPMGSRIVKRLQLLNEFLDAYRAIEELELDP